MESPARPLEASSGPIDGVLPVEGLPLRVRPHRGFTPFRPRLDRVTPTAVLVVGLPVIGLLMLLTAANVAGQVGLWDNAQRTAAGIVATLVAAASVRRATGFDRRLRMLISAGCAFWLISQLGWDLEVALGIATFPGPSDMARLLTVIPANLALLLVVRRRVRRMSRAFYIDSAIIFLAITALVLQAFGDTFAPQGALVAFVAVAYPTLYLGTAGVGLMALLAVRAELRLPGGYLVLAAFAVLGFTWAAWLRQAAGTYPDPGSLVSYAFSAGILGVGIAGAALRMRELEGNRSSRGTTVAQMALPLLALSVSVSLIETRHLADLRLGLVDLMAIAIIVLTAIRQTVLVQERGHLLDLAHHARAELEVALRRQEVTDARYRGLVEHLPAGVYIDVEDPSVTDGGRLDYMSPQCGSILGYTPAEFIADPELWPGRMHPEDRDAALARYAEHWRTGEPLRTDYRMITMDGRVVWVHDEAYAAIDAEGRHVSHGLIVDTTDQKRLEAQLLHDALHDPLTGLANRVLFSDHLERALLRRRPRHAMVALLFLDIDDFKIVNDSLGHRAGDQLLIEVGRRIEGSIRAGDVAARQGGDEFTVLLQGVRAIEEVQVAAERVAARLRSPIDIEGRSLVISVSIGIALAEGPEMVADDLLAHADAAMYAAKALGKARYAAFDPSMRVRARSRLELGAELRTAIEREEFEVHYQPIVDLPTRQIVGFEALVRWRHPTRGIVPPADFIPLSEATGLIVPLGRLVTAEACRQLREWRDAAPGRDHLTMSVNVSPRQALEPGFIGEIRDVLATTRLEPSALIVEITESLMLRESTTSDSTLRQLREMGVQIVIDDFGTGFSALEYFKRFAINGLKIDRSFVSGLGRSREDTAIVTATLAFASALDMGVTAEGVETLDQLARLQALGCQRAQGYLLAPPMRADKVPALLAPGGMISMGTPALAA